MRLLSHAQNSAFEPSLETPRVGGNGPKRRSWRLSRLDTFQNMSNIYISHDLWFDFVVPGKWSRQLTKERTMNKKFGKSGLPTNAAIRTVEAATEAQAVQQP